MRACLVAAVWALLCLTAAAQQIPRGLDRFLPVPTDNPMSAKTLELGRRLFFDRRLSRDESISCGSCHQPENAFTDGRGKAVGVGGRVGARNAPALLNLVYATRLFWDGRVIRLEEQVVMPISDPREMDLAVDVAAARVGLSTTELAKALASYVRSILAGDSRFDRFVEGDRTALSDDEQAGLKLFRGKARCTSCHLGPTLSDDRLHNTGVAWRDGRFLDDGAGDGKFKTPTLREIGRTAPYMHDGSAATLQAVIDYYDRGGNRHEVLDPEVHPLGLSAEEKSQLHAFLLSLSGRIQEGA